MSQKTRPVFIFNLILSLVFPICSALSASDDEVNLSPNFWQQSGEAIFNREYPDGITPRAVILNKMTSSAYREGDTYSVENETGYVALFHEFDPRFVNSPAYTEYNIDHVMIHKSIETHHYLSRMADGLRYEPFSGKILPHIEVLLEEAGLTYRNTIAKTRLISFGDLGESSVYRYAFSQQGGVVFDANTETVTEDGVEGLIGGPSYLAIVRSGLKRDVEMATGLLGLVELTGRMPAGKTPHQVLNEMRWPEHIVNEAVFEHIIGTVSGIRDLELTFPEEKRKETTEASIPESPGRVIDNHMEANLASLSIPTLRLADGSLRVTTRDGITTTAMSGNIADLAKGAGVPLNSLQLPNSQFPNSPPPSVTIPAGTAATVVSNHMDRNLFAVPMAY